MSKNRFEDLKRWFHVSMPLPEGESLARRRFYRKVEPLASWLQERWQRYCIPATEVSVDEMMVRFQGRSHHTVRMPNKPIPHGYKILALAEHGYTYSFMWTSRLDGFCGVDKPYPGPHPFGSQLELSPTSRAVFWLCSQLPLATYRFILFCDNYFSNIPLFQALMLHKMAACGTVRPNSAGYPAALKVKKKQVTLANWGDMAGVVSNGVLAVIWQDKTLVRFLTTAYDMSDKRPENFTERARKRPRLPKNNKKFVDMILKVWGDQHRKVLKLPTASVAYNLFMGGVDIADQRRSYFTTQFRTVRSWMPLFFWLLDTSITNCFLIAQDLVGGRKGSLYRDQKTFMLNLAWALATEGQKYCLSGECTAPSHSQNIGTQGMTQAKPGPTVTSSSTGTLHRRDGQFSRGNKPKGNTAASRQQGYVTALTELPICRVQFPGMPAHVLVKIPTPKLCWYCRYLCKKVERLRVQIQDEGLDSAGSDLDASHNANSKGRQRRSTFVCSTCEIAGERIPLCKDFCFQRFHDDSHVLVP